MSKDLILNFFDDKNLDIRKTKNGRWIDQKCTPDVTNIVSDCICNYIQSNNNEFTIGDIWNAKYTESIVKQIFKKPSVKSNKAKNEYDKFFSQPIKMFAAAGILKETKKGNSNHYTVNNSDILEYISIRERNSLEFLIIYIEKTLRDSCLMKPFLNFFEQQDADSYATVKKSFSDFTIKYTEINTQRECGRIFSKIINPLAFIRNLKGTKRGRISPDIISYDALMYNRLNFRDILSEKPKSMTRKEYLNSEIYIDTRHRKEAYYRYLSSKAKKFLKKYNDENRSSKPEILKDALPDDKATHIHHIFPESEYLDISHFYENLIALTPTQHLNHAHPNGNTSLICKEYQNLLLVAKTAVIEEDLNEHKDNSIYSFSDLKYVLKVGFNNDDAELIKDMDFISIVTFINEQYASTLKSDIY